METDDVYHFLSELENMPMIEADEEMIELYKEKNYLTLMEFLCHPEWDWYLIYKKFQNFDCWLNHL